MLVSHWPLDRRPTEVLRYPEFAQWCGTGLTAGWHARFRAAVAVYGHLHIPAHHDLRGVRFEEVSLGYPREWEPPGRCGRGPLRRILRGAGDRGAAAARCDRGGGVRRPGRRGHLPRRGGAAGEGRAGPPPGVRHRAPLRARGARPPRVPPAPIGTGPRREPLWPPGWSARSRTAPATGPPRWHRETALAAIGIDAEPTALLPDGVAEAVTTAASRNCCAAISHTDPPAHWDRLLFSAKESVYKAWYPLTGRWLGFEDAELSIDPASRAFTARLLIEGSRTDGGPPLTALHGRYLVPTADPHRRRRAMRRVRRTVSSTWARRSTPGPWRKPRRAPPALQ